MRKPHAFRPAADPLESRTVLSSVSVAMHAAQLGAFHPPLQINSSPRTLRAGLPAPTGGATVAPRVATTPSAGLGTNALLAGRTGPFGTLPSNSLAGNSLTNNINNGFFTTANNPNFGLATTGVSNGLAFNNGLGLPGNLGSLAFNNGASTGLAFNNGLGLPGNSAGLGGATGLNVNNGLGTLASTGLNFNNGLGGFGTLGSMLGTLGSTGLNFNNGLGGFGNFVTGTGTGNVAFNNAFGQF